MNQARELVLVNKAHQKRFKRNASYELAQFVVDYSHKKYQLGKRTERKLVKRAFINKLNDYFETNHIAKNKQNVSLSIVLIIMERALRRGEE